MELKKIFNDYLNYCQLYKKHGTYLAYKKSFVLLLKVFNSLGLSNTSQFSSDTFDNLVRWLKINTNKKNSKINSLLSDMMAAFRKSNITLPFNQNKLHDDTVHYKSLNDTELDQLISYIDSLDKNFSNNLVWITSILIMLDTGVRKNELLNIKTKNVDFDNNSIHLDITKNKKRVVKFGPLSKDYIAELYNINHKYLLWNRLRNERLSRRSLERFLEKINKNLSLNSGNVHPHRLRKTFATKLLKAGCPLTTIQKLLGHSSIVMTMIYLDIDHQMIDQDYADYYPY